MSFQIVTELKEIDRLQEPWNELAGDRPFSSWDWYHSWFQSEGKRRHAMPFVLVERVAGKVSMIIPFYLTRSKLGSSRLCLAADGHTCTDYAQIVAAPQEQSFAIAKLASWLTTFNQSRTNIDYVEFDGLAGDASTTRELLKRFDGSGFLPSTELLPNCWAVDLPSSWNELDATFSRKHRRKTKKAAQRIEESQILDSQNRDFEWLWDSFVNLHQKRRRALGDTGCFAKPDFEKFLKTATHGLAQRGLAEILVVESNKQPIAATVIFHDRETAFMYQSGFDPVLAKQEPGYVLIVAAMQWSIAKGLSRFDFLRGNEAYKARWNTVPVPMVRLRFQLSNNFRTRLENSLAGSTKVVRSSLSRLGLLANAS